MKIEGDPPSIKGKYLDGIARFDILGETNLSFKMSMSLTPLAEMIIELAIEHNCWIRHSRNWFLPEEFSHFYGTSYSLTKEYVKILNPMAELRKGRVVVLNRLLGGLDRMEAYDIVSRMIALEEKIEANNYRPLPDQKDEIVIPDIWKCLAFD